MEEPRAISVPPESGHRFATVLRRAWLPVPELAQSFYLGLFLSGFDAPSRANPLRSVCVTYVTKGLTNRAIQ
jgi:hypothetical protein